MAYINGKKILQVVKTEFTPAVYQEKTITPQTFTPEVVADSGYAALSKVKLKGVLVDPHEAYTTQTDSTIAYQKTTPSGALKYASLDKVCGMSYKSINKGNSEWKLGDYNATTGEYENAENYVCNNEVYCGVKPNTTYTYTSTPSRPLYIHFYASDKSYLGHTQQVNSGATFTTPNNCAYIRYNTTSQQISTTNLVMINEGTTALPYVEYIGDFEGIRDSLVTSVNDLLIPTEIQALEGYGWGINDTCYNYIDYEAKKFIQKVGRVKVSALTIQYNSEYQVFYSYIIGKANGFTNILMARFNTVSKAYQVLGNLEISGTAGGNGFNFKDTSCANITEFTTKYGNDYIYYELETPIETDISQYIDNNLIDVSGGTTTFNNEYNQAVPSEVTYLVEVSNG